MKRIALFAILMIAFVLVQTHGKCEPPGKLTTKCELSITNDWQQSYVSDITLEKSFVPAVIYLNSYSGYNTEVINIFKISCTYDYIGTSKLKTTLYGNNLMIYKYAATSRKTLLSDSYSLYSALDNLRGYKSTVLIISQTCKLTATARSGVIKNLYFNNYSTNMQSCSYNYKGNPDRFY